MTSSLFSSSVRPMDLTLNLEPSANCGLAWSGVSGRHLGKLDPGGKTLVSLCLIPLTPGLQVKFYYIP